MTRPPPAQPSFGALLLGCPPAPGYSVPADDLPGPWQRQFISRYASKRVILRGRKVGRRCVSVYSGLFTANSAGKRWVLETATVAQLTLRPRPSTPPEAWDRQLAAVRACLQERGGRPVQLLIMVGELLPIAAALSLIPAALQGVSAGITDVKIRYAAKAPEHLQAEDTWRPQADAATAFLRDLAAALPNLTTLDLITFPATVPQAAQLPSLRQVSADGVYVPGSAQALGSLVPQLTHLQFRFHRMATEFSRFSDAFRNTSHTLTQLTIDVLNDLILPHLLTQAPTLTHLTAQYVEFRDDYSTRQWGVHSLSITPGEIVDLEPLAGLPTCTAGKMVLGSIDKFGDPSLTLRISVDDDEGLDEDLCGRFSEWEFKGASVVLVKPHASLLAFEQEQALRNTLTQLASLQAKGAQVVLKGWQWGAEMALCITELLPALPQYYFGLVCEQLDDRLLQTSATLGTRLCGIRVEGLSVTHHHSDKSWGFGDFEVTECSAAQLAKLPRTSGSAAHRTVRIRRVDIESDVLQVGVDKVCEWLANVTLHPSLVRPTEPKLVRIVCPTDTTEEVMLEALRAQIQVARAMRFVGGDKWAHAKLVPVGWPMTQHVTDALKELPQWSVYEEQ